MARRPSYRLWSRDALRQLTGIVASGAVAITPAAPAFADIVPEAAAGGGTTTQTAVSASGLITTGTIENRGGASVGLNVFQEFNVGSTQTYTLQQPSGSDALVNIVRGTSASTIAAGGTLNIEHADVGTRSNVFIVDPNGFVVNGTINAGLLTMSTSTAGFADDLAGSVTAENGSVAQLFAGQEPLSGAGITLGATGKINAVGLELRSGLEMVLDGTITVSDPSAAAGAPAVAVNTEGRPQATGVTVQNGVIRFGSGGGARIGGQIKAQRGSSGGAIVGQSGALTLKTGASLDVSGDNGGAIVLFTEGSAILEQGTRLNTTSVAGSGGFAFVKALGALETATAAGGAIELAGDASLLEGASIALSHDVSTQGADLSLIGYDSISVASGVRVATDASGATRPAGDLIFSSPSISVAAGATLAAQSSAGGGLIALVSSSGAGGGIWSISDIGAQSGVTITGATLTGGALVLSSDAHTSTVITQSDIAAAETQNDTNLLNIDAALDQAKTLAKTALTNQLLAIDAKSPLQINTLDATAAVRITGATLTADGTWGNPNGLSAAAAGADNGVLSASGAARTSYGLSGLTGLTRSVLMPGAFDASTIDVFVQSSASTSVDVDVGTKALSANIARTERSSSVVLDGTTITAGAGTAINAIAFEHIDIETASRDIEGKAFSLTYGTSDTRNQIVLNGGSITGPQTKVQALTGKTEKIIHEARSSTGAKGAGAVTISIANSRTEAAVNLGVTGSSLDVRAETLRFAQSRTTNATTGVDSDLAETDQTTQRGTASEGEDFGNGVTQDASDDSSDAPSRATNYGLAVDVQLSRDETRAAIGAAATDMGLTAGLTGVDTALVDLSGAMSLDAVQRFARSDEGGADLQRNVHAVLGELPNGATGNFAATSLMSMNGAVIAELGSGATVDAATAKVNALSSIGSPTHASGSQALVEGFIDQIAASQLLGISDAVEIAQLPTPAALLNSADFITSSTGVRTLVQDGASQAGARGAGVTVSNLNTQTQALVRDGAKITTAGQLDVSARTEGVFLHDSPNASAAARVAGETPGVAGNVVGGSLIFGRTIAETKAEVQGAAVLNTGNVSVRADSVVVQMARTEGGGAGASKSINAAIATNALETKTYARVSEAAELTSEDVVIAATDASQVVSIAGSTSESGGRAAGAGAAINVINRDTQASFGQSAAAPAASATLGSLAIRAANTGVALASGIAATRTSGSLSGPPPAENTTNTKGPNHLLTSDENTALNSQSDRSTRANQSGGTQRTGWSVSGAAALNIMTRDDASAMLARNAQVDLTSGGLEITATSAAKTLAIGGAVFRGMGRASKSTGLAGAFALNFDTNGRNTTATLEGARISGASALIRAEDNVTNLAVAAGGGGKTKPGSAIGGSVALVNETGATQAIVKNAQIDVTGDLSVTSQNTARLMALGGAAGASLSLKGAGIGAGVAVVTSSRDSDTRISDGTRLTGANLTASSLARQQVVSIGASIAAGKRGVSGSVAVNTLTGKARVLIGTEAGAGAILAAASMALTAQDDNTIWSLSGAVGVGKTGAVGAGLSINTLTSTTELAVLNSNLSGPSNLSLGAVGLSKIKSRAAAGAASAGNTAGIGMSVNTVSADTLTRFDGSSVSADSASITARNARVIQSRAGGAAGTSSAAAGLGIAANTLAGNDTRVSLNAAQITTTGDLNAEAITASQIDSKAAALSFAAGNSGAASTAVGVIETQTRVQAAGAILNVGAGLNLTAKKTSSVDVLAGAVALSGSGTSVGGAVAVNVLRDTVTADLTTTANVSAGALNVFAQNGASVTSRALSGALSGGAALSGSLVYTQIGAKPSGAVSVTGPAAQPGQAAASDTEAARDGALADVTAQTGATYALDQEDLTRARIELGAGTLSAGTIDVTATETSVIDTNAGGFTAGLGNAGGVGVNMALLFGKTEASLENGGAVTLAGPLNVSAQQNGIVTLNARAGSAGRSFTGAGSLVIGWFDRQTDARLTGGTLLTQGADVSFRASQAGSLTARAGGATAGASTAIGGAVIFGRIADNAAVHVQDARVDTRLPTTGGNSYAGAGDLSLRADNTLNIDQLSQGLGFSSNLAFAGSFGVTIIDTDTDVIVRRADINAASATITSALNNQMATNAWSLAGGKAAGAFAVVSNTADGRILSNIDQSQIRTGETLRVKADALIDIDAYANSGAGAGSFALSGSAVANDIGNRAEAIVQDSSGTNASQLLSRGTAIVESASRADTAVGGGITGAGAGSGAFGGSVVTTVSRNQALSTLRDGAALDGLGYSTANTRIGAVQGAFVDSHTQSRLDITSVTAGVAGGYAGAAAVVYNTANDSALTRIGVNTGASVNGLRDATSGTTQQTFTPFGVSGASDGQDAVVMALSENFGDLLVGTAAASGTAAAGASAATTKVTSQALVDVTYGEVFAVRDIALGADVLVDLDPKVLGLSAAAFGAAASLTYSDIATTSSVNLAGAVISSGRNLTLQSDARNNVALRTGNFAGGKAAGAGSFGVTRIASSTGISIAATTATRTVLAGDPSAPVLSTETVAINSDVSSGGASVLRSVARNTLDGIAVAGAAGGAAVSFAANVGLLESRSAIALGADQTLSANSITLDAREETALVHNVGVGAIAGVGVGGSLDYISFGGDVTVALGADARLTAANALVIDAAANRSITSRIGVASLTGSSATAAVSILDVGGSSGNVSSEAGAMLGTLDTALSASETEAAELASRSGAASQRSAALAGRGASALQAARIDDVGVAVNSGAELRGSAITMQGNIATDIDQRVGVVGFSSAGVSASVGTVQLASDVRVSVAGDAQLLSDGDITLEARTGGLNGGNAVDSQVANLSGALAVSGAAGLSFIDNRATAAVEVSGSARLGGDTANQASTLRMQAIRGARVTGTTLNISAGSAAVGVSRAEVKNRGLASVTVTGPSQILAADVQISALDASSVAAAATGATGGVVSGSGVETVASAVGSTQVILNGANVTAQTVRISNRSQATADANSTGFNVGALAVGVTLSNAEFGADVTTQLRDTSITADTLDVTTAVSLDGNQTPHARASSFAGTGGLAAGAGTTARATTAYSVLTIVDGSSQLYGQASLRLGSQASQVTADANAKGVTVGGAIAVGVVTSEAGQIGNRIGRVTTLIKQGEIASLGDVELFADNTQNIKVDTVAGSGGLLSGSGSIANTRVNADTALVTGSAPNDAGTGLAVASTSGPLGSLGTGPVVLTAGDAAAPGATDSTLTIRASQDTVLSSSLNNTNASAIGFSGGRVNGTLVYATNANIGGGTLARGNRIDISANHAVDRPKDGSGFNIRSNSGGAFDGASINSETSVDARTNVTLENGSRVHQLGDLDFFQSVLIGVSTQTNLTDRVTLDAGGGLALPLGRSVVVVNRNDANVTFKDTDVFAIGPLRVYSGSSADIRAEANATSYGLAGSASATTGATYKAQNLITIENGAHLESRYDVFLRAGYQRSSLQSVAVNAESRVFNKTLIPVTRAPTADALSDTTTAIDIKSGAKVFAYQDVFVEAADGARQVRGYGLAKDFYLVLLAEIANAVGGVFGLDPIVFDIRRGTSQDLASNKITVNGELRAGAYSKRSLLLDAGLTDTSGAAGSREEIFWSINEDVSIAALLQARLDAVEAQLADPDLPADPTDGQRVVLNATKTKLEDDLRVATASGLTNDIITIAPLYAAEGSLRLLADTLEGAGGLSAAGDVLVQIESEAGASVAIEGIAVSGNQGGQISFNNQLVTSNAGITEISEGGSQSFDIAIENGDGRNQINVVTLASPSEVSAGRDGTIDVVGNITNEAGNILLASNKGSLSLRADVSGVDITLSADVDIDATVEGLFRAGGDPAAGYQDLFRASAPGIARNIFSPTGGTSDFIPSDQFHVRASGSGITAGRNVTIIAQTVNINSTIKAGTGTYKVQINAGIDSEIDALRASGRTGRTLIYDSAAFATQNTVKSSNIDANTNVNVFYNHDTDQIELDNMLVRGGEVSITGNIISTGTGRIEALDGQGALDLDSLASVDVVLKSVDLGGTAGGAGLAGLVRITDISKRTSDGRVLTTEFRRVGGEVTQVSNETFETIVDPILGTSVDVPTFLVDKTAGRSGVYTPVENRDFVVQQHTEYDVLFDQTYQYYVEGDWTFISTKRHLFPLYIRREAVNGQTFFQDAPQILPSISGIDYGYHTTSQVLVGSLDQSKNFVPGGPLPSVIQQKDRFDNTLLPIVSNVFEHHSGGVHLITRQRLSTHREVQIDTHRLRADYPVQIFFSGSDSSSFDIQTKGNVILSEAIANGAGPSTIISSDGSILTAGNTVNFTTQDLTLRAPNGAITGLGGAFQIDLINGGALTATAANEINVLELSGDLSLDEVSTSARGLGAGGEQLGAITLTAQGNILHQSGASPALAGSDISLTALEGGVGDAAGALRIDTADGGVLNVDARDSVALAEVSGDLGLGTVRSRGGSVTLDVPLGAVLDRNDTQDRDIRTRDQLIDLWNSDLGLTAGSKRAEDRYNAQVANLKLQRERDYIDYWAARAANGGADVVYVMSDEEAEGLLTHDAAGNDDTRLIDARQTEMDLLYKHWNKTSESFDPAYSYTVTDVEKAEITNGYLWTEQELTRSIQDGTILRIGDTDTQIEAANIIAGGDITVRAQNVGELLAPYQVAGGGALTDRDFEVLATAGPGDVTVEGDTTFIRQQQDVDFELGVGGDGLALGALRVIASDRDIYLGAETAAQLAKLDAAEQVQIRVNGLLTDARDAQFAVNGKNLILEAGEGGAIGTLANPLTVNVLSGGSLTARAGGDVNIAAPLSDLPVSTVFSAGTARLTTTGAITDGLGLETSRIVAGGIDLTGATIGTSAAPLRIEQTEAGAGQVNLASTNGGLHVIGQGGLALNKLNSAAGGLLDIRGTAPLTLEGMNTLQFAQNASFALISEAGLVTAQSTGTDITGGTLLGTAGAAWGSQTAPITTQIATLSFGPQAATSMPSLWLSETDALVLANADFGQNAATANLRVGGKLSGTLLGDSAATLNAAEADMTTLAASSLSLTTTGAARLRDATVTGSAQVMTGGAMTIDLANVGALTARSDQGATLGTVTASAALSAQSAGSMTVTDGKAGTVLTLNAGTDLTVTKGTAATADLDAGQNLTATLDALQTDAAAKSGALNLTLVGRNGHIGTLSTDGGTLTLRGQTASTSAGVIRSNAGAIDASFTGDFLQEAGSIVSSQTGSVTLNVSGDLTANRIETGGARLSLQTDGRLRALDAANEILSANAVGAQMVLRLGESGEASETGLRINAANLTASATRGDLHLLETDGMRAVDVTAQAGTLDLSSRGTLDIARAQGTTVTLTSARDLVSTGGVIDGDAINLFAFGGSITGAGAAATGAFTADTKQGARLVLHARDDLRFAESNGALNVAIGNARTGDLEITNADPSGGLVTESLGAGGTLTVTGNADMKFNLIGGGQIDLVDEQALELIDRSNPRYGPFQLSTPKDLVLTAGSQGAISIALAQVSGSATLTAAQVSGALHDTTPEDGLDLAVRAPQDGYAKVDLFTVADGYTGPAAGAVLQVDLTKPISGGDLRIANSRVSEGQITQNGDVLDVKTTQVSGPVRLRQRETEVLATLDFTGLDPVAQLQILARDDLTDGSVPKGSITFVVNANGTASTTNQLVLSRDIDVLVLNVSPAQITDVLIDQIAILTTGPEFSAVELGRTKQLLELLFPGFFETNNPLSRSVRLPLTTAALGRQ